VLSRWMPPYRPAEPGPPSRALLAVLLPLAAWSLWYLARHPIALLVGGGLATVIWLVGLLLAGRQERRAQERVGEDIGTFARAFDRHASTFDPWVVRAVWDALGPWTAGRDGSRFPLRPTDVIADLGCVDEDLEDVFVEAATRARRQREALPANPYLGRVVTVGDLVAFISHQPREAAA
jgi:hypothetical protein